MRLIRIREAQPLDDYRVRLTLTDGRVVERDIRPMLAGPVFAGIRGDEARFREMRVEGGTLVWPSGADLCPDVLIWGGLPPADAASDAAGGSSGLRIRCGDRNRRQFSMRYTAGSGTGRGWRVRRQRAGPTPLRLAR
jgi:hypothetical protein